MFDVERLLGQMLSGGIGGGGDRRERRRSSGFGLPGIGKAQLGIGAIGVAIAAWEHYKSKQAPAPAQGAYAPTPAAAMPPPPPPPPFAAPPGPAASLPTPTPAPAPITPPTQASDAAHLIRAMIAAANADGLIDAQERSGILERAMEAGLDPATQQFLMAELRAPASLEDIIAATRPELRLETYAAALLAIDVDTDAERAWLDRLAAALALGAEDRQRVCEQLGA